MREKYKIFALRTAEIKSSEINMEKVVRKKIGRECKKDEQIETR